MLKLDLMCIRTLSERRNVMDEESRKAILTFRLCALFRSARPEAEQAKLVIDDGGENSLATYSHVCTLCRRNPNLMRKQIHHTSG